MRRYCRQLTGWNIDVRGDDGAGLPSGKGTVQRARGLRRAMRRLPWRFGEGEGRFPKLWAAQGRSG